MKDGVDEDNTYLDDVVSCLMRVIYQSSIPLQGRRSTCYLRQAGNYVLPGGAESAIVWLSYD